MKNTESINLNPLIQFLLRLAMLSIVIVKIILFSIVAKTTKDRKQLVLNVDTGTGRYMKTNDEGVDVLRYYNRTDTILYY